MKFRFEGNARKGLPPAEDLTPAEVVMHERLRAIYALYDAGKLTVEEAKAQKEGGERLYREMDCVWSNCEEMTYRNIRLWKELEAAACEFRKLPADDLAERAAKGNEMLEIIYNVGGFAR